MSEQNDDNLLAVPGDGLIPVRRALRSSPAGDQRFAAAPQPTPETPVTSAHLHREMASAPVSIAPPAHLWVILSYFGVSFGSQILLLISAFSPFRIELRMLPFCLSLLLALLPMKTRVAGWRAHRSISMAVIIICITAFGLLNQETDSVVAGLAQLALSVAVLSPLLWMGRLQIDVKGFTLIVICLWSFNALSAGVGVLQVVFPGHFQPATSAVVQAHEEEGFELNIELADGTQTTRPYGLTDQPGGAAAAGLTAFVFGLGLLVSTKNPLVRTLYLAGMGVGLFIMYLSQVRGSIVMSAIAVIAFVVIMAMRGEVVRLTGALFALAIVITLSTFAAFTIGGAQTRERLFTLVDDSAGQVYYNNRGTFLEYTFAYVLPEYPVGAGLGRYGMISHYFGHENNSLWAEIQWTAWAYDGGWLMVAAYPVALLIALWVSFDVGRTRRYGPVGLWAAILTSYNFSVIAILFSYPFFVSQAGLEFWLLNAALWSAAQTQLRAGQQEVPEGFEVIPAPWKPSLASGPGSSSPESGPRRRPLLHRPLPAVVPVFDVSQQAEGNA